MSVISLAGGSDGLNRSVISGTYVSTFEPPQFPPSLRRQGREIPPPTFGWLRRNKCR